MKVIPKGLCKRGHEYIIRWLISFREKRSSKEYQSCDLWTDRQTRSCFILTKKRVFRSACAWERWPHNHNTPTCYQKWISECYSSNTFEMMGPLMRSIVAFIHEISLKSHKKCNIKTVLWEKNKLNVSNIYGWIKNWITWWVILVYL